MSIMSLVPSTSTHLLCSACSTAKSWMFDINVTGNARALQPDIFPTTATCLHSSNAAMTLGCYFRQIFFHDMCQRYNDLLKRR